MFAYFGNMFATHTDNAITTTCHLFVLFLFPPLGDWSMKFYKENYANINTHTKREKLYYPIATEEKEPKNRKERGKSKKTETYIHGAFHLSMIDIIYSYNNLRSVEKFLDYSSVILRGILNTGIYCTILRCPSGSGSWGYAWCVKRWRLVSTRAKRGTTEFSNKINK